MTRIAVLFTNLGPYHLSRIDSLHGQCSSMGWDVIAIELARYEAEYAWLAKIDNLPFTVVSVLKSEQLEQVKFNQLLRHLYAVLSQVKPDVLAIAGYARPAMLAALLWSHWHGKPAILFSETHEHDAPRSMGRETIKSLLLKGYKAALVGGKPQKRYLVKLGMAPDAIFLGYNTVGNETFHPDKIKPLPRLIHKPYFLTINRFVPKKNLLFLLSSYAAYRQAAGAKAWDLVVCGDGPLRTQIEQQITDLGLKDVVHLPGFLQQDELLPYFAHAGGFIHASIQEQWGLVVNEAMAAGLPVLVSNRCGCYEDLVIEGVNGFGFDPENFQQLTDLMLKISAPSVDVQAMEKAALEHIEKFSPDYFARGLIQAIEYTLASA